MEIKGICWMGIGTNSFDQTVDFFTQVLGLEVALIEKPVAMLRAGPGQIVEVFGEGSTRGKTLTTPPAIAFEVNDVMAARAELLAKGVELIGDVGSWNGHEWLYFRGPENYVFAIKKTPPAKGEENT